MAHDNYTGRLGNQLFERVSDYSGLSFIPLFYSLGFSAIIFNLPRAFNNCLITAPSQRDVQSVGRELIGLQQRFTSNANSDTKCYREVRLGL